MADIKLSRRRMLQLVAGTFAGAVLQVQGTLRIDASRFPASKALERLRAEAFAESSHGIVPRGMLSVAPPLPDQATPPPRPPGGRPPPPRPPRPTFAPTNAPTTIAPTVEPTPSPIASANSGRFGRMFPNLPAYSAADDDLRRLAVSMIEGLNEDGSGPVEVEEATAPSNNGNLPAGYTYLGQLIDHDLTFDPTPLGQQEVDPNALRNFRTPRFELDNLYGNGPADNPYLYQNDGVRLLIGKNRTGEDDLPRNSEEDNARALIGDPRNDENLILSQLHLAFIKYHNRVVGEIGHSATLFADAQRTVRFHYQWLVLYDFLTRIVGTEMVDNVLRNKPQFFKLTGQPFMPVEFSGAAYRFGHSMIRSTYSLNEQTAGENPDGSPREINLFDPSDLTSITANDLRGFRRRPANRQIDWSHFFEFPGKKDNMQVARAFDTQLSHGLGGLPLAVTGAFPQSLAERNLKRGVMLGLPSGQAVARAMGVPDSQIITANNSTLRFQIGTGYIMDGKIEETVPHIDAAEKTYLEGKFGLETPLWYYILKEAELINKGRQLGPVGGRIVAEVFIGLMQADSQSFLNLNPAWKPRKGQFGCRQDGSFTMNDLLTHVQ